ncbi:MAG: hypothetical protein WBP45_09765 [Daejeonella sp.]
MKKIIILLLMYSIATPLFAQPAKNGRKKLIDYNKAGMAISLAIDQMSKFSFNGFMALPPRTHSKFNFMFGFESGVTYLDGRNEKVPRAPYNYVLPGFFCTYVGGTYFFNKTQVGLGVEYQSVNKIGENTDQESFCGRLYVRTKMGNNTVMFNCNMGGEQFHYMGHWSIPLSPDTQVGIYANNATTGIGPLLRFSIKQAPNMPLLGVSIGYNPNSEQAGFAIMMIN